MSIFYEFTSMVGLRNLYSNASKSFVSADIKGLNISENDVSDAVYTGRFGSLGG